MHVLMVGVSKKRNGGMWIVAEQYINSPEFNSKVKLTYIATSTKGSIILKSLFMLIGYIRILWILYTQKIDIVHIHMADKGSTFRKGIVAKWARQKGKKVIIHLHAGNFPIWYKTVSIDKKKRIRRFFDYANVVLVLGEYWRNELKEIIPECKMQVLYNGTKCPDKNQYNPDVRNIVFFGRMSKEKGTYDLIDAIKKIDNQLPKDIKVILCGNDVAGNISEMIKKAGLSDRFELPGWVTGETKEEIYKNAMIYVHPSYYEGLSMAVLEAMSRGIPVITTNISTMPEVVGTRSMIEPGNIDSLASRIMEFVLSREERICISSDEFDCVKRVFSNKQFIDNTLSIYSHL